MTSIQDQQIRVSLILDRPAKAMSRDDLPQFELDENLGERDVAAL